MIKPELFVSGERDCIMAASREIQCITRRPGRHDPHESILGFGGIHNGEFWWLDEATLITKIEQGAGSFCVKANSRTCRVVVASDNDRKYVKASMDHFAPNILLNLPECAPEARQTTGT